MAGNAILITGGGSGIGRGLAEAFHRLGNKVIIAGRRESALQAVVADNPGISAFTLDIEDPDAIREFATRVSAAFPTLNVLVNNAGIQRTENLLIPTDALAALEKSVKTNLIGPIRLTAELLPQLMRQPKSIVMNVTSGLAFVPGAGVPTYSATKAAMHSYTVSLRHQLRTSPVRVIEVIPPYVQTDLGPNHGTDPRAMPLADFIAESIAILQSEPDATEVVVERCKPLRFAAEAGTFDDTFKTLDGAMWSQAPPSPKAK
jgi:uncharacterized oxidoreductase